MSFLPEAIWFFHVSTLVVGKSREHESKNIRNAMSKSSGNQAQAARLLGMTARQFLYRLSKLGSEISHA
ncbi:MAG: hypothetical protein IE913_03125 [Halothiobacillus sp.]|nr:hypothetical protein [Halothiobacillus sp.]